MMMYKETTKVIPLGDDREITILDGKTCQAGRRARSVVEQGDTMLLATVVAARRRQAGRGFHAAFGGI